MPDIRLGVAIVCSLENELLLGLRSADPGNGKWDLPGTPIGLLETTREAALRALEAETGIRAELGQILATAEIIKPPIEHRVALIFGATPITRTAVPGGNCRDVRWWRRDQIALMDANDALSPAVAGVLRETGWLARRHA